MRESEGKEERERRGQIFWVGERVKVNRRKREERVDFLGRRGRAGEIRH